MARFDNHEKSKKHKEKVALLKQLMKEEGEKVGENCVESEEVEIKEDAGFADILNETEVLCENSNGSNMRTGNNDASSDDAASHDQSDYYDASDQISASVGEQSSNEAHGADLSEVRELHPEIASCNNNAAVVLEEMIASGASSEEEDLSVQNM